MSTALDLYNDSKIAHRLRHLPPVSIWVNCPIYWLWIRPRTFTNCFWYDFHNSAPAITMNSWIIVALISATGSVKSGFINNWANYSFRASYLNSVHLRAKSRQTLHHADEVVYWLFGFWILIPKSTIEPGPSAVSNILSDLRICYPQRSNQWTWNYKVLNLMFLKIKIQYFTSGTPHRTVPAAVVWNTAPKRDRPCRDKLRKVFQNRETMNGKKLLF